MNRNPANKLTGNGRHRTKRQRKALAAPNAMVRRSLRDGQQIDVGKASYFGAAPVYAEAREHPMMPSTWRKVVRGVPFVRVR